MVIMLYLLARCNRAIRLASQEKDLASVDILERPEIKKALKAAIDMHGIESVLAYINENTSRKDITHFFLLAAFRVSSIGDKLRFNVSAGDEIDQRLTKLN